jgi:hypothetical protein
VERDRRRQDRALDFRQADVQAAAARIVGELFEAGDSVPESNPGSCGDSGFSAHLIDCELAMTVVGESPLRIALHMAVLRVAHDSGRTYAEIRALPEVRAARRRRPGRPG